MPSGFAGEVEFADLVLVDRGETFVYSCEVAGERLFFETVVNPTGRELLDAALWAWRGDAG